MIAPSSTRFEAAGRAGGRVLAERVGFEPTVRLLTIHALSRRAPSTARSPLPRTAPALRSDSTGRTLRPSPCRSASDTVTPSLDPQAIGGKRTFVGSGTLRTSDGVMLAFRVHPAPGPRSPRIALVHSLGIDRSMWDGVVSEMKDQAEILTYDCRGHGRSERRAMPY